MIPSHVSESALSLPDHDRLELARRLIESVSSDRQVMELIEQGVQRMEDVVLGRATPLSEEEFRAALK
ncbi:MAG: addiction module antitoxin RelB [Opitutaceae bacterium]|nr:addiction module antitoxin RelB [Opitutaceae bacterium]